MKRAPSPPLPVVFVGHGSPLNATLDNEWSRGFRRLATELPRPRAVLAVSAHWYTAGTFLTGQEAPPTLHDFAGFSPELFAVSYPAPGDPALAERARELVGADRAALRGDWGLDHGTWSVLRWLYPKADVPVVQLSLDHRLAPAEHYALAQRLRPLRDEGVLIFASGNIVHNLAHAFRGGGHAGGTPDWASRFDQAVADALGRHDEPMLLGLWPGTADGRMSHPAPDHLLPLFYAAGAASEEDRVRFPITGFDLGSISMRSVLFESPQGGQRPC